MSETKRELKRIELTRDNAAGKPEPSTFWADIFARPTGGELSKYIRVVNEHSGMPTSYEIAVQLVLIFTHEWNLRDEASGELLKVDAPGYEQADGEYLKQLATAIWQIVGPRVPKL